MAKRKSALVPSCKKYASLSEDIQPIQLLYFASIAGGLGTPVLMILLFIAAGDEKVMGKQRVVGIARIGGWVTAGVVSLSSLVYLVYQWLNPG